MAIGGCAAERRKSSTPEATDNMNVVSYPSIDSGLGEKLYPDEKIRLMP